MAKASFEEWLDACFSHRGYDLFEGEEPLSPIDIAEYMTRFFTNSMVFVGHLPPDQIADGLWYMLGSGSSYWWDVRDKSVPQDIQIRTVLALRDLYRDLFDVLCDERRTKPAADTNRFNRLDGVVYMIWDMSVLEGAAMFPGEEHLVGPIFAVLGEALECDTVACQISGLHGLGHLHSHHPRRVESLIDRFLKRKDLTPLVVSYSKQARTGSVL